MDTWKLERIFGILQVRIVLLEPEKDIYKILVEMNERGDYFPLWGTCLGFELFSFYSSNLTEHRDRCSAVFVTLPLVFAPGNP